MHIRCAANRPPHVCLRCAHSLCCQQRAKSSARRWLCTFSALPANSTAGTMAYNSAGRCCCAHPLCCQQDRLTRHFSQYAVGLLCTFSALPANSTASTMAYNSAGRCCCAHPLCCQQDMLTRHFLNMQSVLAVHILCAASIHHGRIRSMLLSLHMGKSAVHIRCAANRPPHVCLRVNNIKSIN